MSKKQLRNRLENLFANLVDNTVEQPPVQTSLPPVLKPWNWETDENGCYTVCEDTITAYLGYSPAELIGQSLVSFGLSEDSASVLQNAIHQNHFPLDITVVFLSKKGNPLPARLTIFKKLGSTQLNGGFRGFVQPLVESESIKPPIVKDLPSEKKNHQRNKALIRIPISI